MHIICLQLCVSWVSKTHFLTFSQQNCWYHNSVMCLWCYFIMSDAQYREVTKKTFVFVILVITTRGLCVYNIYVHLYTCMCMCNFFFPVTSSIYCAVDCFSNQCRFFSYVCLPAYDTSQNYAFFSNHYWTSKGK